MKRNSLILILAFFSFLSNDVLAQLHRCGIGEEEVTELTRRVQANLDALYENPIFFRNTQYVPVVVHLAGLNDGSQRGLIRNALIQVCDLNNDFSEMNIQFYLKDVNFINNSIVYLEHFRTVETIMRSQRDRNAINIFVVENLEAPSDVDQPGVTQGYWDRWRDWLVIRKDQLGNTNNITMTHEMGHFFSLPHPHNGWDIRPFVPDPPPQWAVNAGLSPSPNPVPIVSPGGILTERQNGTNCETAGDFICDTPPDYQFGLGWPNCDYTNEVFDPQGNQVDPDETLYMSYFFGCPSSENKFTEMQKQLMIQDLNSNERAHLRGGNVPNTTEITEKPDLISPISGETTPSINSIEFEWGSVNGADAYVFELSTSPAFGSVVLDRIVFSNSFVMDEVTLLASRLYYWRVRPYNAGYLCAAPSNFGIFRSGVATTVRELPFVNSLTISPNPVKPSGDLNINLKTDQSFEADLRLYGMNGQLVRQIGQQSFNIGENQLNIPVGDLSRGVYFLSLQTEEGRISKRVVVAD